MQLNIIYFDSFIHLINRRTTNLLKAILQDYNSILSIFIRLGYFKTNRI